MEDQPVDGYIYGQPPPKADDRVPDIEGMMEATGIPKTEPGALPNSLEWYAGAKDRQKARDKETDELLMRKNDLRYEWSMLVSTDLSQTHDRVQGIADEPQPLDLALLLARAAHERPKDREEAELLAEMDKRVQADRDRLQKELADIMECLKHNENRILEKEAADQADEDKRIASVKEERKKKAKNERALARNNARLRGDTDVPDTDEEEAAVAAAEAAEEAKAAQLHQDAVDRSSSKSVASSRIPSHAPSAAPSATPSAAPSRMPSHATSRMPSHANIGAVTVSPPGSRGGPGAQLPPLADPPQPPVGANLSPTTLP